MSTLGSTSRGVQSIRGIPGVRREMFSTSGGYHEYIRDNIMSTSEGYHEYIVGCSVHWGMFSTSEFSIEIERILSSCSPTCIMTSL